MRALPVGSTHLLSWNYVNAALLVSIHGTALRVAAQLPVSRGADGPAAARVRTAASGAAFLQGQQLLSTEGLVVDLAGGLDQVLQVGAGQEVAQVNEFAVVLILDVDHTPAVLTTADLLAVDNNGLLATDDGERNDILVKLAAELFYIPDRSSP